MTEKTTEERLIELEIKISHQEIALEELQQGVYEQHATIAILEKSLKLLTERIDGTTAGKPEVGPGNDKPPHY